MNARAEMLGKLVSRLVMVESRCDPEDLGVLQDLLEKLYSDFVQHDWNSHLRKSPWHAELKKFLRKEPCWEFKFSLQGDQEIQFRWVAEQVVFHTQEVLSNEDLGNLLRCAPCTRDFWRGNSSLSLVPYFVGLLLGRGVVRLHEKGYEVIMTMKEFENRFGVKLPN